MSFGEEVIDLANDDSEPITEEPLNSFENHESYEGFHDNTLDCEVVDLVSTPVPRRRRSQRSKVDWRGIEKMKDTTQRVALVDLTQDSQASSSCTSDTNFTLGTEQQSEKKPIPKGIECIVCYKFEADIISASCGHVCCTKCMEKILEVSRKCPVCRKTISKKLLRRIYF